MGRILVHALLRHQLVVHLELDCLDDLLTRQLVYDRIFLVVCNLAVLVHSLVHLIVPVHVLGVQHVLLLCSI